jgi:hypothetical protein
MQTMNEIPKRQNKWRMNRGEIVEKACNSLSEWRAKSFFIIRDEKRKFEWQQ